MPVRSRLFAQLAQPQSLSVQLNGKFGQRVDVWVPMGNSLAAIGATRNITVNYTNAAFATSRFGREARKTGADFTNGLTLPAVPGAGYQCWLLVAGSTIATNAGTAPCFIDAGNNGMQLDPNGVTIRASSTNVITTSVAPLPGEAVFGVLRQGDYRAYQRGVRYSAGGSFGSPLATAAVGRINHSFVLLARWTDETPDDDMIWELLSNPWQLLVQRRGIWVPGLGGNSYSVSLSEAVAPADTVGRTLVAVALLSEAASAADSTAVQLLATSAVAEAASAADTLAGTAARPAALAEAVSLADSLAAVAAVAAAASEAIAAADAASALLVASVAVSEAVAPADAASTGPVVAATIDEGLTLAEALSASLAALVQASEAANAGDTLAVIVAASAAQLEAVVLGDTLARVLSATALLGEPAALADTVAVPGAGVYAAALSEAIAAADVVLAVVDGVLVLTVAPRRRISAGAERAASQAGVERQAAEAAALRPAGTAATERPATSASTSRPTQRPRPGR